MNKMNKFLIAISLSASVVALGAGITLASSYIAPKEENTINFSGIDGNSNKNVQDLQYYFGGGTGDSEDPYLIKNAAQLRNLSRLQNLGLFPDGQYVTLANSIQYEGDSMEPIGTLSHPFTGVFNGGNHSISFLNVSTSTNSYVGMFGVLGSSTMTGTVRRLLLIGPTVEYTGSLMTLDIGFVAGKVTNENSHASVVQEIEIYGGNNAANTMSSLYATISITNGTPHTNGAIVGTGVYNTTSGTSAGFIESLASNVINKYTSTAKYETTLTTGTTSLYVSGGVVTKKTS